MTTEPTNTPAPSTPQQSSTANIITVEKSSVLTPLAGERLSLAEGLARMREMRGNAVTKAPAKAVVADDPPAAQVRANRNPEPDDPGDDGFYDDDEPVVVREQPRKAQQDDEQPPVDGNEEDDETAIEIDEEQEPAPEAALQAPASYNAEEKAAFAALPQPAQKAALRLEQTRRAAFSRDQRAVDDVRQRAEASLQQVEVERQFLLSHVAPLLQSMQQQHQGEFADIRGPADAARMADVDPARFARWQAQRLVLAEAQQSQELLQQREQQIAAERDREAGGKELAKLSQTVKGWDTPEGLQKGMTQLRSYVLSYDGVTQQDLAMFRKAPFVEMARKASLYDQAVARKKTAATPSARTAAPSPARVASGTALAQTNRALQRLQGSGSFDDAMAAMRARRGIRQR